MLQPFVPNKALEQIILETIMFIGSKVKVRH